MEQRSFAEELGTIIIVVAFYGAAIAIGSLAARWIIAQFA